MKKHLKHSKWLMRIIVFLRLQKLATFLLTKFPIINKLTNKTTYRITSPEALMTANEVFKSPAYDSFLQKAHIEYFVDLGCNTGFITCLLSDTYGKANIKGILIDANPAMIKESQWHIVKNEMKNCKAIWGVVGTSDKEFSPFYIPEFNISSSAKKYDENFPSPITDNVKQINVPVLDVLKLWTEFFNDKRIHLLKIDIEGNESEFCDNNKELLQKTDWVIMEWHKWHVSLEQIDQKMKNAGFRQEEIAKEDAICGLVIYRNSNLTD